MGRTDSGVRQRFLAAAVAVGLFVLAFAVGRVTRETIANSLGVGGSATVGGILASVFALQLLGFGLGAVLFLWTRERGWRASLRLGTLDQWTLFYGAAVGLTLMLLTVGATVLSHLLDVAPTEAAAGQAQDPLFYLLLFALSTFVVAPMEELFFRGIIQRHLTGAFHPGIAIAVASLLFAAIHTTLLVSTTPEAVALGLFVSFGVALGVSYHLTGNLLVPIIGHAMYNGIQILVRTLEVL